MTGALVGGTVYSLSNDRRFEHWAWVPEGNGPFPLMLLLHGVNDAGGFVWWQQGHVHTTAARLVAAGEIPPMIILMASDTGAGLGTGYCDWVDGTTRAETYLVNELLPWADANLPVAAGPKCISGLSMGGYGALLLALRHPGLFSSASSLSGFFDPARMLKYVPRADERLWGTDEVRRAHDVLALVEEGRADAGLRLAFDCGTDDELIEQNRRLHALLDSRSVAHGYAEHLGGHEWDYWAEHIGDHLRFHAGAPGPLTDQRQLMGKQR
jgi:S-formylglutathione hydrolase FrmB